MRDEDHSSVVAGEAALELLDRLDVEVVRRLVEDEAVDAAGGQEREAGAGALARRQRLGRAEDVVGAEAELREQRARGSSSKSRKISSSVCGPVSAARSCSTRRGRRRGRATRCRPERHPAEPVEQDRAALTGPQTLLEVFRDFEEGTARTLLAKFSLGADDVLRSADSLSPGERTRAGLALLTARGVNCLVLDEPTNHLDVEAIEELERGLAGYDGTVILVTHDRRFLEAFAPGRTIEL